MKDLKNQILDIIDGKSKISDSEKIERANSNFHPDEIDFIVDLSDDLPLEDHSQKQGESENNDFEKTKLNPETQEPLVKDPDNRSGIINNDGDHPL